MKALRILVVEDDVEWLEVFLDNLQTVDPERLAGPEYNALEIRHAADQVEADHAVAEAGPNGYDLVLLDLRYPEKPRDKPKDDPDVDFQGMKWLPELRRLQPRAAIVILTGFPYERDLFNAVSAIREHHANDFVPKMTPIDQVVWRLYLACENARHLNRQLFIEEKYHSLVQSIAARTYAEDVGTLLCQTNVSLYRIATRLESGDASAPHAAPEEIRAAVRSLMEQFGELTTRLSVGKESCREIDVTEIVRQAIKLYERRSEIARTKMSGPDEEQSVKATTFEGDLEVALYEVLLNALDSLEESHTPPKQREIRISVERADGEVVVRVVDNGHGFSDAAMENMFDPWKTLSKDDRHRGFGLYVARRMMHAIGGSISVRNRSEGGAEVELRFGDLP